jgi:drug/metabolite transporter (DMT)-like permease
MKLHPAEMLAALPAPTQGAIWMVLSGFLFTGAAAAVRQLSSDMDFIQISFFRAMFGIPLMLPWLASVGLSVLRTRQTGKYVMRSVVSVSANLCWFAALAMIPIADATAVSFITPIFITIAAMLVLRERSGVKRWIGLLVGFAGTAIILRPGVAELNVGALWVLASAVLFAGSALFVKILVREDRPDTVTLYQLIYMLPIAFFPAMFVWVWPTPGQWVWAAMVGIFVTLAQRCYTRAYAAADASAIQPFDFLRLPFAILVGFVLFAEWPDLWSVIGGTVIFASSIFVVHGEARASRRA